MDWPAFFAENVSPVVAFTAALFTVCGTTIGIMLGVAGARLMQSKQQRTQRKMALDDPKMQWERSRQLFVSSQIRQLFALIKEHQEKFSNDGFSEDAMRSQRRKFSEMALSIDTDFDKKLDKLFAEFVKKGEPGPTEMAHPDKIEAIHRQIQYRLSELQRKTFE